MIKGTYKRMMGGTDQWAAMIGINLPVAPWSIGKYSGKVEENEALLHSTEQSISDMQNMIGSEVRDAYAKVISRTEQLNRYKKTILPQTEQAFDATLASYRIDKADFLSLLDSYRMLQMFRMEYYMALGDYLSNVATLERAIGKELK
jgi:outer membrane protein TolC